MKENISKNKVWQIVGVSVLCAVLVLGAVLGVVFGMNHSSEDLNVSKDMSEMKPDNSFVSELQCEQGITLMSGMATTSADGTTSKTITASFQPADTTNKTVDWSVAFKNASSSWANGKSVSDYVTVTPSSDGALTATITCKKAFGEQIILTCSSRVIPEISATATIDYTKKIVSITPAFNDGTSDLGYMPFGNLNKTYTVKGTVTYSSVYSLDDTFNVVTEVKVADAFYNSMPSSVKSYSKNHSSYSSDTSIYMSDIHLLAYCYNYLEDGILKPAQLNALKNAFTGAIKQGTRFLDIRYTYTGTYSNGEITSFALVGNPSFDVSATGVTLDSGSIVF